MKKARQFTKIKVNEAPSDSRLENPIDEAGNEINRRIESHAPDCDSNTASDPADGMVSTSVIADASSAMRGRSSPRALGPTRSHSCAGKYRRASASRQGQHRFAEGRPLRQHHSAWLQPLAPTLANGSTGGRCGAIRARSTRPAKIGHPA